MCNTFSDPTTLLVVSIIALFYLEDVRAVGHLQETSDFYVLPSANGTA